MGLARTGPPQVEVPELFARFGVERLEVAVVRAREDDASGGREQACPGRAEHAMLPNRFAR